MGTSRLTIRQAVGDKTGDLLLLEATANAAAGFFTDSVRMGDRGDNAPSLVNRIGYFVAGTPDNIGIEVRSTAFQTSTRTLTLTPAASLAATVVGDQLELWSIADRMGSLSGIHRLINDGIRAVDDIAGREVYDTAATFNYRSPQIAIPSTWAEIGGAEWADRQGFLSDIRKQDAKVRPGRRTVELMGRGSALANARSVTLWGYERSLPLETDTDETDVDPEWLVENVASIMTLAQSWKAGDRAAEERRANFWSTKAQEYRRKTGSPRRGWGIRLPEPQS